MLARRDPASDRGGVSPTGVLPSGVARPGVVAPSSGAHARTGADPTTCPYAWGGPAPAPAFAPALGPGGDAPLALGTVSAVSPARWLATRPAAALAAALSDTTGTPLGMLGSVPMDSGIPTDAGTVADPPSDSSSHVG